jgi:tight adherence protein C
MDATLDFLIAASGGRPIAIMGLLVFLSAATLAFGVMATMRVRGEVKRRAAGIATTAVLDDPAAGSRSLRHASIKAAQRLVDYTSRYYSTADQGNVRMLRRRLIQAGFLDPRAVAFFFMARMVFCVTVLAVAYFGLPLLVPNMGSALSAMVIAMSGLIGYMLPGFYINRRIGNRQNEHRAGFPDFMDLLVVCADAGLSMEASLDRVGRELGDSYPSLCANLHMTNLEIRAGRSLAEALEHLGDRLGLEEARAFATLLQQSDELGSSVTEALRVYSDDMRHKRLSRAEEKAYSLPAKLAIPLILCIFPVLLIVIMLPAVVRLKLGGF